MFTLTVQDLQYMTAPQIAAFAAFEETKETTKMALTIEKSGVGNYWIYENGNSDPIGSIRSVEREGEIQNSKLGYQVVMYTKPFAEIDVLRDDWKEVTKTVHSGTLQSCKKYVQSL